ncbi:flavodoxin family protein [Chloroflexota bacterium]
MKVLGLMGSPRKHGNTDLLLAEALKGTVSEGAQVETLVTNNLTINPCLEDYGCAITGICTIRDDMDDIYEKLLEADRIIIASPMFFYSMPSQLKALIDRSQALWARKYLLKQKLPDGDRKGAFIGVGATKGKNLFDGAKLTMKYFYDAINVKYVDNLLIRSVDQKGEIKEYPTALKDAYDLGKRLAQI